MAYKVVHKYKLPPMIGNQKILVKKDSKAISAENQNGGLVIWVLEPLNEKEFVEMEFKFVGTGVEWNDSYKYRFLNTVQLMDGDYVLHVFVQVVPDSPAPTAPVLDVPTEGA